jgi:hypothetical protein
MKAGPNEDKQIDCYHNIIVLMELDFYSYFNTAEKEDCLVLLNNNIISVITKHLESKEKEIKYRALFYFGEIVSKGLINLSGEERELLINKISESSIIEKIMRIREDNEVAEGIKLFASAILLRLEGTKLLSDDMIKDLNDIQHYFLDYSSAVAVEYDDYSFASKQRQRFLVLYAALTSFCTLFREKTNLGFFEGNQKDFLTPVCTCDNKVLFI